MNAINEIKRLNDIANSDSGYDRGINRKMIIYTTLIFMREMEGYGYEGGVLELGPAHGLMTDIIHKKYKDYTVVDASETYVNLIKEKCPNVNTEVALFEEYLPNRKYKFIILGHVLEHVLNPVVVLNKCYDWLDDDGIIMAAVPNARSLHRQVGAMMGLIESEEKLHDGDIKIGHRRVYDMNRFVADFESSNLKVIKKGGYWLKPLSNKQIEENWSEELIDCFMAMGEKYPDIACNIYVIAKKKDEIKCNLEI